MIKIINYNIYLDIDKDMDVYSDIHLYELINQILLAYM